MKYPKFVNDETFYSLHDGLKEVDLLKQFASNLKTIHNLTTKHYQDFDSLIKEYLIAGSRIFNLEFGIVSNINGEEYLVCDAVSPENVLEPGAIFELEGTYCREVIYTKRVIGFPHVGSIEEMKGHPVYINMKLESYISAPIFKGSEIFGTLNFSSTRIRRNGFSEYERELISMMANAIGSFLLLKDREEKLASANTRIKKLTGFVAHDLRTPLGNIVGLAALIPDLDKSEAGEMSKEIIKISSESMEMVQTILESAILGEGSLQLEKGLGLLGEEFKKSLNHHSTAIEAAKINFDIQDDRTQVSFDEKRMSQVFNNLVGNCCKYTKSGTTVEVDISKQGEFVFFKMSSIINNENKQGDENFLMRSYGLGNEIIDQVLKLHSSQLQIENDGERYIASFLIK